MLPINVALFSKSGAVQLAELTHVASALAIQVTRDFSPIWGISATVTALSDPRKVPPGYWPIFIVDNLPPTEGGFHLTKHKQPYAEVEAGPTWSLAASHELIEMLVDPSGSRTAAGVGLTVANGKIVENPADRVEYLVEACDPCESEDLAYLIGDVMVSDFFTPHYHDPTPTVPTPGVRYSFTGALTKPREVLPGGYISWADLTTGHLMQIKYLTAVPQLVDLTAQHGDLGDLSLREFVNRAEAQAHERGASALSNVPDSHPLYKASEVRRAALENAAEGKGAAYVRS
jgi:hypothetical protein